MPLLRRRGTILITTMVISIALAGTVIVLCRSMRVEMQASANLAAAAEASSVERGAEQYILALLATQKDGLHDMSQDDFAAVPVGNGYFWLVRPDYDDAMLPLFGLVEENAKLNLNSATYAQLERLPGMTYPAASSIMDWKDDDENIERDGAESDYYLSLPEPYYCKDGNFETVEEVLMVREVYRDMLYGDGTPLPPLGEPISSRGSIGSPGSMYTDPMIARGIYELLTVYSVEPETGSSGARKTNIQTFNNTSTRNTVLKLLTDRISDARAKQIMQAAGTQAFNNNILELAVRGKMTAEEFDLICDDIMIGTNSNTTAMMGWINVKTAPRAVLLCLEGLSEEDVDNILAARTSINMSTAKLGWLAEALGARAAALTSRITHKSDQFSADILAVSGNGRAFKRVRIVVNTADGAPQIVYRRDISERGWPMNPEILASIRRGEAMASGARNVLPGTGSRF